MRIELCESEYREGFQDATDGNPARIGASWSYLSGWIEGEAVRLNSGASARGVMRADDPRNLA